MVTRRELVTAGALGAISATGASDGAAPANAIPAQIREVADVQIVQALHGILAELGALRRMLGDALNGPSAPDGTVADVRRQFGVFLRSNQKYPDYCEIGSSVFTDLYDWQVRNRLPIEVVNTDGRMSIRFMFTWMVLRTDQDVKFVGIPYDKG